MFPPTVKTAGFHNAIIMMEKNDNFLFVRSIKTYKRTYKNLIFLGPKQKFSDSLENDEWIEFFSFCKYPALKNKTVSHIVSIRCTDIESYDIVQDISKEEVSYIVCGNPYPEKHSSCEKQKERHDQESNSAQLETEILTEALLRMAKAFKNFGDMR